MRERTPRGGGPRATADLLWEDPRSGDRLRISIRLDRERDAAFVADLEATGFRRVRASAETGRLDEMGQSDETDTTHPRRTGPAGEKDGEDGGTLPCSIDVVSAFQAPGSEFTLADRMPSDEDAARDGLASA